MIITVASFKGGVGKTTTAVHLAAYMAAKAPTLLLDGDENRSATAWAQRGELPFRVADERQAAKLGRSFEHLVIDTQARPNHDDLKALAEGCDLLVIPSTPDVLALDALILTVEALKGLRNVSYRVLLTVVQPRPNRDGERHAPPSPNLKSPPSNGCIHRLIAFQKAALKGVPVSQVDDPRAWSAWNDYEKIGRTDPSMSKFTSAMNAARGRSLTVAEAVESTPYTPPAPYVAPSIRASQPSPTPPPFSSAADAPQANAAASKACRSPHNPGRDPLRHQDRPPDELPQGGRKQDFSDLIQELLTDWLATQNVQ